MIASILCVQFAPTAAGPGIPEIKAYLNGVDTPNMFGASTLIVKVSRMQCQLSFYLLSSSSCRQYRGNYWPCTLTMRYLF